MAVSFTCINCGHILDDSNDIYDEMGERNAKQMLSAYIQISGDWEIYM